MIYLDNSATTRPFDCVVDAMADAMRTRYFNPSAMYGPAIMVEKELQACRDAVATQLGVTPTEVFFTGSGTEADNLALLGVAERTRGSRTFLLTPLEHPAVHETAAKIIAMGHRVAYLPVTHIGLVDVAACRTLLTPEVALVSCMQVQNETGAVQPLEALRDEMIRFAPDALLHVDGVQGFLRVPMTLPQTHVSLYTLSAHKIHGPKGVGALVIRKGVRLTPRIVGGGQEQGMRSGTENMPGIVGLRTAIEAFAALPQPGMHLREMKLSFYKQLRAYIPTLCVNGPDPESTEAAPHILNVSLPGVRGEVMLHALEEKGVFVSTGSACSSKKRKHSPVLEAMRMSAEDMESAIRISLSPMNTMEEMQDAAQAFFACHEVYKHYKRR